MEKQTKNIYKIEIVGPESAGKTHLGKALAKYFNEPLVKEYARDFLNSKLSYSQTDLIKIAEGQINAEKKAIKIAKKYIFCDSSLLTIEVWSRIKYGEVSQDLKKFIANHPRNYPISLLAYPDLPYENDPLRENPQLEDRKAIFKLYQKKLKEVRANYLIVKGEGNNRVKTAIDFIESQFK